jgi:TRAP-type mannitol/chloroaromatic compound transport system permease small subunit
VSRVHRLAAALDRFAHWWGRKLAWMTVLMVLIQLGVVLARYVFGVGSVWAQESIVYLHALVFMLLAGYALAQNQHVRVDIFYRSAQPRTKAWINLLGTLLFLFPFCVMILVTSWPYVGQAWAVMEGSRETQGIPGVFLLKTGILVFAGLLVVQGLSLLLRSLLAIRGDAGELQALSAEG